MQDARLQARIVGPDGSVGPDGGLRFAAQDLQARAEGLQLRWPPLHRSDEGEEGVGGGQGATAQQAPHHRLEPARDALGADRDLTVEAAQLLQPRHDLTLVEQGERHPDAGLLAVCLGARADRGSVAAGLRAIRAVAAAGQHPDQEQERQHSPQPCGEGGGEGRRAVHPAFHDGREGVATAPRSSRGPRARKRGSAADPRRTPERALSPDFAPNG